MIFSEIYGAYYKCLTEILKTAVSRNINEKDIRLAVNKYAFSESLISIENSIRSENWSLIKSDGSTPIKHNPTIPLSKLEKMWLKAIMQDKRIKLFEPEISGLDDVEPLFNTDDYCIFDNYSDGDPYESEEYIKHFRLVLSAVKAHCPLRIGIRNKKGLLSEVSVIPECMEYSEKDDKFRLITSGTKYNTTVNIARIIYCERLSGNVPKQKPLVKNRFAELKMTLTDERNALERVMLHFSHFEKEAVKLDDKNYLITIKYDRFDETEILIRVLSFGPKLKVISPQSFIDLIKNRLIMQKKLILPKDENQDN